MPPLDEFQREVVAYLPGLLALLDIADAKGRNFHLGHRVVDRASDFGRRGRTGEASRLR